MQLLVSYFVTRVSHVRFVVVFESFVILCREIAIVVRVEIAEKSVDVFWLFIRDPDNSFLRFLPAVNPSSCAQQKEQTYLESASQSKFKELTLATNNVPVCRKLPILHKYFKV